MPAPYRSIIEALLFVAEEPLKVENIARILEVSQEEVTESLKELEEELLKNNRGIRVFKVNQGYRLGTPPEYAHYLDKLFSEETRPTLSRAALETLAIIAYRQPITRVEIEAIRGVRSGGVLDNLQKRKLIKTEGRKETPGRPLMYATTGEFLKYFGLNDLQELPPLEGES